MVGDRVPADGAEVDGVERLELFEPVVGHHLAVLGVVLRAPREVLPLEGEAAAGVLGERVEDGAAGLDDLDADSVGGDGGDAKVLGGGHGSLQRDGGCGVPQ